MFNHRPQIILSFLFIFSIHHIHVNSKTITVGPSGDFKKVQAAIDSLPTPNISLADSLSPSSDSKVEWTTIHIQAGVYKEKVVIVKGKGNLVLEGEGVDKTSIEYGDTVTSITKSGANRKLQTSIKADVSTVSTNTFMADVPTSVPVNDNFDKQILMSVEGQPNALEDSTTFAVLADNVVVKGITFKNTYSPDSTPDRALAALFKGDKIAVYNCNFLGLQDTVCDFLGRHYFRGCRMEGNTDFVFGFAQSIHEDCTLHTVPRKGQNVGWLTAHNRKSEQDEGGYVFKNCKVTGELKTYLGRAWGTYSRVIFYNSVFDDIIVPAGWDAWNSPGRGAETTFAEVNCKGPGAAKSNNNTRVLIKALSNAQISKFASLSFIDDGWLAKQPVKMSSS